MQCIKKINGLLFLLLLALPFYTLGQNNTDVQLAYQYFRQNDFEKAAPLFEKIFATSKNDAYLDLYVQSLVGANKANQAESLLKKLIKQNPTNVQYQSSLAFIYTKQNKTTEAQKIYAEQIKNLPKNEFAIRNLANSFYQTQAYDMAITTFLQGRKILEDERAFTFDLLAFYRLKKDKPSLINEYVEALTTMPQLLPQAESTLGAIFENNTDYQNLQIALLRKIQKAPDVTVLTELLIWQYLQQQHYEMALRQLIAFDKRTKANGLLIYQTAQTFVANKAYTTAQKAFEYLIEKGPENEFYVNARILLINVKCELAFESNADKTVLGGLANELQQMITDYGFDNKTVFAVQKLAELKAFKLNDLKGATELLEHAVAGKMLDPKLVAQLKLQLGDLYLADNQSWDALLLYEQVSRTFENQNLGHEAVFKSAMVSFYQGNFGYSKSQADVLKASTSQLIANDALNLSLLISDNLQQPTDSLPLKMYADAEMLQSINKTQLALEKLDSINVKYANNKLSDDILMAKAKIYVKTRQFDQAASALAKLLAQDPQSVWADDALFTLADLQENKLQNKEEAKKYYQELITNHPGSMFVTEARKRFRNLRGDNMGS